MTPKQVREFFEKAAADTQDLRYSVLFNANSPQDADMTPEQAQFMLLGVAAIDQAQRFFVLAKLQSK